MKTLSFLFVFALSYGSLSAQTWSWESAPKAGENINVHIKDASQERPFHMVYYCFDGTQLIAGDVGMLPTDNPLQIHAAIALHDHVSWIRVVLKDENGEIISADQQTVMNEKALPKAWMIEEALAASIYARPLGMEVNEAIVTDQFSLAIKDYPQWLDEPEVLRGYYSMAKRANTTEALNSIKNHLESLSAKPRNVSETNLVQAVRIAKDMADTTLQLTLRKKLDKNFPKSILAQEDLLNSFTKAATVEEKIKIRDQFKSRYPITKENTRMMDQMTSSLAQHYASKEDWTMMKSYVDQIKDPMTRASVSNNYAWSLSGESIEAEAPDLEIAGNLSSTSLSLLSAETTVPTGLTKTEWNENLEGTRAMYGDTYALILFKQGKYEEALDHQLYSVKKYEYQDAEMNERYAAYLEKAGHQEELEKFMDQIYISGKANEKVKALHRKYWTQDMTQDQLYDQYVAQLEAQAKAMREEKIGKMWQDDDAVSFTIKDLNGNTVSLTDYKGKTVILDFWATWCGPCKASFPGMKKAVEFYASDESVVFLFIDTWENSENLQSRVTDFIKTNNYPFHVLMDSENKIVVDYKVKGIPTKFIIGPDQKIRFTAVGYNGNNDELVEEIKTMIEMVQNHTGMQKS